MDNTIAIKRTRLLIMVCMFAKIIHHDLTFTSLELPECVVAGGKPFLITVMHWFYITDPTGGIISEIISKKNEIALFQIQNNSQLRREIFQDRFGGLMPLLQVDSFMISTYKRCSCKKKKRWWWVPGIIWPTKLLKKFTLDEIWSFVPVEKHAGNKLDSYTTTGFQKPCPIL
jgi:hypothetical protein